MGNSWEICTKLQEDWTRASSSVISIRRRRGCRLKGLATWACRV